ncbi:hypothetical protein ASPVEDRAFT_23718 [Aspergillus versicolor CBS 583.65]|uniref:Zn(2)-C6 fungal-type domain-containing protein n=1 Tax=Aspergillus versicolor CBS 583.65 TaxID=1036611 RepID=A0A1L9P5E7_ASPVE|nr:uncharacterized protein ASPVEDRAFT_23718 [Aspergillus versicolor CBS 583.65]OJI96728.1 hypothetical protein ASPVEDRAFT_23718 [Aspergillus versicolor CBS 583.65]
MPEIDEKISRKKTKCPGERPICSFCLRLDTACVYLPRGSMPTNGIGKKAVADARSSLWALRVGLILLQLLCILCSSFVHRSSANRQMELSPDATASVVEPMSESPERSMDGHVEARNVVQSPSQHCAFTLARPRPPVEVIEHFVEVYRTRIHLQPLPLFHLGRLADQLLAGPEFVLWSFLSLMLKISSHPYFKTQQHAAEDFYARSSEDTTMRLSSGGKPSLDVTRSLCLIAMKHIKSSQPAQAWMAIGIASRLYAMRTLFNKKHIPESADDAEARAYWSVFVLERLFLPYESELPATNIYKYPETAALPPPPLYPPTSASTSNTSDREMVDEPPGKDIGINGYSLRITSIWGKIRLYLHRLSQGEIEKPWLADSIHTKLGIELIEFEAQHSKHHLLLNVAFPNRSAAEIDQQREYWNPWMTTEILWHAAQAILNHPFLHLVVLRSQTDIPQSCVFLQQKVDMALYHVSWLFRILKLSEGSMTISNPILGDAIAACATVLWLFQFTRDEKVARRMCDNLDICENHLNTIGHLWPHISQKLVTFRKLRVLADQNRSQATHQETTINFKSEWLWDLLLPSMSETTHNVDLDSLEGLRTHETSNMRLKTHFVDRLPEASEADREQDYLDSLPPSIYSFPTNLDNMEHFNIDQLSRDLLENDLWGIFT